MQLTLHIPDDLAAELRPGEGRLPRILRLGLRELDAQGAAGFTGLADVLELLASLPTPEQVMALRPSQALQDQIDHLLERSHEGALSDEEEQQWRNYQYIEHLVRKSKIRAGVEPMNAIEFQATAHDGILDIPREHQQKLDGRVLRFVLVDA